MALGMLRRAGALGVAAMWLGMIGCSGNAAKPDAAKAADAKADAPQSDSKNDTKTAAAPPAAGNRAPTDDPLYHPFILACRDANDPPPLVNKPADRTLTDKPTFQLFDAVRKQWDEIRFTTPDGHPIKYTAVLDTDCGTIEIELRPDVAPNHVRNFVALIQSGYYDGMHVDRIFHEQNRPADPLIYIEAGCPLDRGDPEDGSIGYWLQPEDASILHHEVGAVGASHGRYPDSAACRFYIMLSDTPDLDGSYTIFGKVTQGLDVARTISLKPVIIDDQNLPGYNRPKDPIIIRNATVRTEVAAAVGGK